MGEVPTRHEVCDAARSEDTSELPLSDNESPEGESDWVTTEESFFEFEEPHEAEVFHELGAGGLEADGLAEARNLKEARDLEILDLEIHGLEEIHRLGSLDLHSIDAQLESVARERETIGLVPGGDGLGRAAKALESDTKEPETLSTKEPEPRTPLPAKKLLSLDNKAPSELKPEEALNTKYPETPDTPTFTIALEYPQDEDSQEETSITEDSGSAPTELQNPSVDIAPQCATSSDHSKDPHEEVHPELVPIVISLHETATPGSPATTIILTTADADDLTPVENKMSGEYAYSRPRPRSSAARSIGDRSIVAVSFVSPEDEVLSLRVRSLYDCSPGGDASSQFSADTSQRRISRIVEEGAAGVSRQRGARSSFPGASKDIVHRSRVSRSVEGRKNSWTGRRFAGSDGVVDLSLSRRGSADRDEVTTFSKRSSVAGGIEDWEDLEGRDVDR